MIPKLDRRPSSPTAAEHLNRLQGADTVEIRDDLPKSTVVQLLRRVLRDVSASAS